MRKRLTSILYLIIILVALILAGGPAESAQRVLAMAGLTGGTNGKLDLIYVNGRSGYYEAIEAGDTATAYDPVSGKELVYEFVVYGSQQTTNSPYKIKPLYYAPEYPYTGYGAWVLVGERVTDLTADTLSMTRETGEVSWERLYEDPANGDHYVQIEPPGSIDTSFTLKWPGALPSRSSGLGYSSTGVGGWNPIDEYVSFAVYPSDESVLAGDGKKPFTVPAALNGYELVGVTASVHTLGAASGSTDVMVRRKRGAANNDMLSGVVTVGYGEYHASDGVINSSYDDVATGDLIYVDIDGVPTTPPQGLGVVLTFRKP